jgi:hypothetical protein
VVPGSTGIISVTIAGVEIYSGPVPGVPDPIIPYDPNFDPSTLQDLFSWPVDIDFMGPVAMKIEVWDCTLRLGSTVSNYSSSTGESELFCNLEYWQEIDGVKCQDPFTNVIINDIPVYRGITPPAPDDPVLLTGQWWWELRPGCIFEATLNVEPGWL